MVRPTRADEAAGKRAGAGEPSKREKAGQKRRWRCRGKQRRRRHSGEQRRRGGAREAQRTLPAAAAPPPGHRAPAPAPVAPDPARGPSTCIGRADRAPSRRPAGARTATAGRWCARARCSVRFQPPRGPLGDVVLVNSERAQFGLAPLLDTPLALAVQGHADDMAIRATSHTSPPMGDVDQRIWAAGYWAAILPRTSPGRQVARHAAGRIVGAWMNSAATRAHLQRFPARQRDRKWLRARPGWHRRHLRARLRRALIPGAWRRAPHRSEPASPVDRRARQPAQTANRATPSRRCGDREDPLSG